MKIIARPLRADGVEELGTLGVVSGNYQSVENFLRYNRQHLTSLHGYIIYRSEGGGSFTELARYYRR